MPFKIYVRLILTANSCVDKPLQPFFHSLKRMFDRQEIWTSIGLDFFVNIEVIALTMLRYNENLSFIKIETSQTRFSTSITTQTKTYYATLYKFKQVFLWSLQKLYSYSDKEITKTFYVNIKDKVNQTVGDIAFRSLKKLMGWIWVNLGWTLIFWKQKDIQELISWVSVNVDIIID